MFLFCKISSGSSCVKEKWTLLLLWSYKLRLSLLRIRCWRFYCRFVRKPWTTTSQTSCHLFYFCCLEIAHYSSLSRDISWKLCRNLHVLCVSVRGTGAYWSASLLISRGSNCFITDCWTTNTQKTSAHKPVWQKWSIKSTSWFFFNNICLIPMFVFFLIPGIMKVKNINFNFSHSDHFLRHVTWSVMDRWITGS